MAARVIRDLGDTAYLEQVATWYSHAWWVLAEVAGQTRGVCHREESVSRAVGSHVPWRPTSIERFTFAGKPAPWPAHSLAGGAWAGLELQSKSERVGETARGTDVAMWDKLLSSGWFLVSASMLLLQWVAPGPSRALWSQQAGGPPMAVLGFQVVWVSVPAVLLGVLSLATLMSQLLGADWAVARKFEWLLPRERKHRLGMLAFQVGVVALALYHLVTF
ncbi:MAG: hypothetical protein U0840_02725 [Gemmataceae bacterium]